MYFTWCQKVINMASISGLKPPNHLQLTENPASHWKAWYRAYQIYAIAAGVTEKTEKIQCCVFLHVAGPDAQKVKETMEFSEEETDKIAPLVNKFTEFCEGKRNITVTRYQFNSNNQKEGETLLTLI